MSLVDTGSVSECSITTATDNPSVGNPIIPRGRTPLELLVALPKEYTRWTPQYIGQTAQRHMLLVFHRLLNLGYLWYDKTEVVLL